MAKHEDSTHLMIQTWVLVIKLFCSYCESHQKKLKDVLRKIPGVNNITINAVEEKVIVTGNVASAYVLLKKLQQCDFVIEVNLCSVAQKEQQHDINTQKQQREQKIGKDSGRDANGHAAVAKSKTQDTKSNTTKQEKEQKLGRHKDIGQVKKDTLFNDQPKMFEMKTLLLATNHFHDDNKVGAGGFGSVYKGTHDGKQIAVKKLSLTGNQGSDEFVNEVKLLAKVQHRNLVKLLGCCVEGLERLIVYEWLPNKSLDQFLFNAGRRKELDWQKRYDIIRGTASGLLYLHQDSQLRIVHRDIKPSNILLDHKFNPKIADFGIAKLFAEDVTRLNTVPAGTIGYMAPECIMSGELSVKADVYSFGVVLLELTTGKRIIDRTSTSSEMLLSRVWRKYIEKNIEQILDPVIIEACDVGKASRCIHIGLLCTQFDSSIRPSMSKVDSMLSNASITLAEPTKPPCVNSVTKNPSRTSHESAVTPYFASPFPSHIPLVAPPKSQSRYDEFSYELSERIFGRLVLL